MFLFFGSDPWSQVMRLSERKVGRKVLAGKRKEEKRRAWDTERQAKGVRD